VPSKKKVIKGDEIIAAFLPAADVLEAAVAHGREVSTVERMAAANPEVTREAGLKRLGGAKRWLVIADRLVVEMAKLPGFGVLTSEAQHNQGQYVYQFPGGVFTVKRDPHDATDPEDGKYLQEALEGVLENAELAPHIDADAAVKVYLAVTAKTAQLKVTHTTLDKPIVIPLGDLVPEAEPMPQHRKADRPRARAKSTRKPAAAPEQRSDDQHT
jgi:hypothetical protein